MGIHNTVKKIFRLNRHDNLPMLASAPRDDRNKNPRLMLAELFTELGFTKGAEIGVRKGNFTKLMCDNVPNLHMYAIDPWGRYNNGRFKEKRQQEIYELAKTRLASSNVSIIRKESMDVVNDFEDGSLDFVHIDGNHWFDYCCPDIIYWSRKVRKDGVVAVHDYCSFQWNGVMKAVDAYTHCHNINPWYVTRHRIPTAFWGKP